MFLFRNISVCESTVCSWHNSCFTSDQFEFVVLWTLRRSRKFKFSCQNEFDHFKLWNVPLREHLFKMHINGRKEGNVLFNDALNTFHLRLYGIGHMVKDHSDSKRGSPLLPHELLRLTARVLLYAPSHRQDSTYHGLCCTSRGALVHINESNSEPFVTCIHLKGALMWIVSFSSVTLCLISGRKPAKLLLRVSDYLKPPAAPTGETTCPQIL